MIHYARERWSSNEWIRALPADLFASSGPGCVTTLRIHNGQPAFFQSHLLRLQADAKALGLVLPDTQEIARVMTSGIRKNRLIRGVARILWRGAHDVQGDAGFGLFVTFEGLRPLPRAARLLLQSHRPSMWRRIKAYAVMESAPFRRLAQHHQCFDSLLHDGPDLTETCTGNLFLFSSGRLVTPPEDGRVLPGITRALILKTPALLASEHRVRRHGLRNVDACFITNCARGIVPVAQIVTGAGKTLWTGNPRHAIILETRKVWRQAMIESTTHEP